MLNITVLSITLLEYITRKIYGISSPTKETHVKLASRSPDNYDHGVQVALDL